MNEFEAIEQTIAQEEERLRLLEIEVNKKREILAQQRQALEILRPLRNGASAHQPVNLPERESQPESPFSIRSAILNALECFPPDKEFAARHVYE
jgi:flagellar biosynthesis chaperone FliJ